MVEPTAYITDRSKEKDREARSPLTRPRVLNPWTPPRVLLNFPPPVSGAFWGNKPTGTWAFGIIHPNHHTGLQLEAPF
jgi:hypothetical protein